MALTLITPATPALAVLDLKHHLKIEVETTIEDDVLTQAIAAAQAQLETAHDLVLVASTWEATRDAFPSGGGLRGQAIPLPKRPVTSVTSVKYLDEAGVLQTLATSLYTVHLGEHRPLIVPAYETVWPTTRRVLDAVVVRFVAGYATAAAIPGDLRAWLLLASAHLYTHRDDGAPLPAGILDALVVNHRLGAGVA